MIIEDCNKNIDTVFISDVHILDEKDTKYHLLISLLEEFLGYKNIKRIIFLGDMFDFCTGIHSFFKKKYIKLKETIEKLHEENNVSFYYIEGNHEFYMADLKWKGVSFSRGDPFYIIGCNNDSDNDDNNDSNLNIMLTHGDVLTPSLVYRFYNFMVRSRIIKYLSYLIRISWLNSFAVWYSSKTRKLHEGNNIKEEVLFDKVNKYMNNKKTDLLVFGHFHRYICFSKNSESDLTSRWVNLGNLNSGFIGLIDWKNPYFVGLSSNEKKVYLYLKEKDYFIKKDERSL